MATYKVIQDIEAEDKLLGPLSLRQFIYAGISVVLLYICFLVVTKGLAFAVILFLPPAALFGFLAFPWKGDQPTEVWALAKIQFLLKPRKRIWNQSGVKELVTITAPKHVEPVRTNGLSQTEVRSRLKALADTLDSRGWVVKNIGPNVYSQPGFLNNTSSDRLVQVETLPQEVPAFASQASDDMLDMQNNPVAQKFGTMIAASQKAHREQILERMRSAEQATAAPQPPAAASAAPQANNYWFLQQPSPAATDIPTNTVTFNTQVVAPGTPASALPAQAATPTADEEAIIHQLKNDPAMTRANSHLHVIQPLSAQNTTAPGTPVPPTPAAPIYPAAIPTANNALPPAPPTPQPQPQQVTPEPDAAILDLARNDDLNVATIAREAQKRKDLPEDEVVISLH